MLTAPRYIYTTTKIKNKCKVDYIAHTTDDYGCILFFIFDIEGNQSTTNIVVLYDTLSHATIYDRVQEWAIT